MQPRAVKAAPGAQNARARPLPVAVLTGLDCAEARNLSAPYRLRRMQYRPGLLDGFLAHVLMPPDPPIIASSNRACGATAPEESGLAGDSSRRHVRPGAVLAVRWSA